MRAFIRVIVSVLSLVTAASRADANLGWLDPRVAARQLAEAEEQYAKRDIKGLMALLEKSHLLIQQDVALKLGRLGADEALPLLRQLDKSYSDFRCVESGQFGVAVILIENKTPLAQRQALLNVATEARTEATHAYSVINCAGRELSRFAGDDIIAALSTINGYGAQYTVLSLQCQKLSRAGAISKCIATLATHQTPQTAGAAERLLMEYGQDAKPQVEILMARMDESIKISESKDEIAQSVRQRCDMILCEIHTSKLIQDCRGLSPTDAISTCVALLEAEASTPAGTATLRFLLTFGSSVREPVQKQILRMEARLKADPNDSNAKTVLEHCHLVMKLTRED